MRCYSHSILPPALSLKYFDLIIITLYNLLGLCPRRSQAHSSPKVFLRDSAGFRCRVTVVRKLTHLSLSARLDSLRASWFPPHSRSGVIHYLKHGLTLRPFSWLLLSIARFNLRELSPCRCVIISTLFDQIQPL